MISGRQALQQIEQAIAQARREEARVETALRGTAEEAARLRVQRMEAFRELARLKLDTMTRGGVVDELDAAEREALRIIESRRRALESLSERRKRAEQAVEQREAERHRRAAELETALKSLDDLRAKVEAEAHNGSDWRTQRARIDQQAEIAKQAEKKAEQAEADRKEKGKPYEADPLFMYLWRKKFGTPEDRSGPFVRFFDRRVARLIGYDKARANYALLNEIPLRLREHAARMNAEIAAERARLTEVERAALDKGGVDPLLAKVVMAKQGLDEAERALAKAKAELAALDREHDASVLNGELPQRDAIELLAKADSAQDLRALYQDAVKTPSPQDDALVRRIEGAEVAIGNTERKMGELRRQAAQLTQRRAALEQEWQNFRQQGYDRPYGGFGNGNVLGGVLGGILGGVIQGAVLRDTLRDGYQRQPGPWDSDFGGGIFPSPGDGGGWIGGGGSDGGFGGDLGGDGGGDGFNTGGSI